jgi:hypothetical protein
MPAPPIKTAATQGTTREATGDFSGVIDSSNIVNLQGFLDYSTQM